MRNTFTKQLQKRMLPIDVFYEFYEIYKEIRPP